jgi:hypothetical protein
LVQTGVGLLDVVKAVDGVDDRLDLVAVEESSGMGTSERARLSMPKSLSVQAFKGFLQGEQSRAARRP